MPGFLANFLQGIVDRFQVVVKNVEAKLETEVTGDGPLTVPLILRLHVGSAELRSTDFHANKRPSQHHGYGERQFKLSDLSLHLLSDETVFSDFSELPSRASPAESRQGIQSPAALKSSDVGSSLSSPPHIPVPSTQHSSANDADFEREPRLSQEADAMHASILTADIDRFADAGEDAVHAGEQSAHSELDIQPGDDNISWGSRRNKSDAVAEDLWNSMVSEDDLPDSLLIESVKSARARTSGTSSPALARHRRDRSPYQRSLQSPGSWPRLEESPDRSRYHQGPGSWPVLNEDRLGAMHLPQHEDIIPTDSGVDNKRNALEASLAASVNADTSSEVSSDSAEDLAASRFFTHEDAESMYVSAMSQSVKMHVPGGWGSEDSQVEDLSSPQPVRMPPQDRQDQMIADEAPFDTYLGSGEEPFGTPGNVTPRAASPVPHDAPDLTIPRSPAKTSRQIIYIDVATVTIPIITAAQTESQGESRPTMTSMNLPHSDMPGAFSTYSERSALHQKPASFSRSDSHSTVSPSLAASSPDDETLYQMKLDIGVFQCQFDTACARLLHRLASKSSSAFSAPSSSQSTQPNNSVDGTSMTVSILKFDAVFRESAARRLDPASPLEPGDNLASLVCRHFTLSSRASSANLRIGTFALFVGSSCLLSFDRHSNAMTSMIITEQSPDIAVIVNNRSALPQRPVVEITADVLPALILVDLPGIEETLEPFGGLSGVLDIGTSVLSDSGATSPALSPSKRSKGVRFEGAPYPSGVQTEVKCNARVGGISTTLQGSSCSIELRTSTVKAIYREHGAVSIVEQVSLSGPYATDEHAKHPVTIDFSTLRLEYLLSPQDKDLERLLSLITPSKDKYDNDDDILLDTLLRQRKKGAVVRASVSHVGFQADNWSIVEPLSDLVGELAKLSAVTEYLPEDDRPGLLTLVRVKEFNAQLPVNEQFGKLNCKLIDFHCARVGLPALLALSIGGIDVSQVGKTALVHSLVQLSGSENLPMVMARVLGDEVEPTVKVKVFNTCIEYSVPTIVALTGMDADASAEEVVAEMANSVANLVHVPDRTFARKDTAASDASNSHAKKMKIEVLVHDSAVGLSPQNFAVEGIAGPHRRTCLSYLSRGSCDSGSTRTSSSRLIRHRSSHLRQRRCGHHNSSFPKQHGYES